MRLCVMGSRNRRDGWWRRRDSRGRCDSSAAAIESPRSAVDSLCRVDGQRSGIARRTEIFRRARHSFNYHRTV